MIEENVKRSNPIEPIISNNTQKVSESKEQSTSESTLPFQHGALENSSEINDIDVCVSTSPDINTLTAQLISETEEAIKFAAGEASNIVDPAERAVYFQSMISLYSKGARV